MASLLTVCALVFLGRVELQITAIEELIWAEIVHVNKGRCGRGVLIASKVIHASQLFHVVVGAVCVNELVFGRRIGKAMTESIIFYNANNITCVNYLLAAHI